MKTVKSFVVLFCLLVISVTGFLCFNNSQKVYADSDVYSFSDYITTPFSVEGYCKILTQDESNIYFLQNYGVEKLAIYNKNTGEFGGLISLPFENNLCAISDGSNLFIAGGYGKFLSYNLTTGEFGELISTPFGTSGNINKIIQDEEYLYLVSGSEFVIYDKNAGIFSSIITPTYSGNILSIEQDNDYIYFGCTNGKFVIYNKLNGICTNKTNPFINKSITPIFYDENNLKIYCGTSDGNGFAIYDTTTGEFGSLIFTPLNMAYISFSQDTDYIYMYSINNQNIEIYNKVTGIFSYLTVEPLGIHSIKTMVQSNNKLYVLTTNNKFFIIYLPENSVELFSVNFYGKDNELLNSQYRRQGQYALIPTPPEVTGYYFVGWDKDATQPITCDMNFFAMYNINIYTLNFYDKNSELITSEMVEYGQTVTPPTPPEVEGYTFNCWLPNITQPITCDMNFFAMYNINIYTLNFYDKNSELITSEMVEYGQTVTPPTPPEVTGYYFVGWNVDISQPITTNIEIYAIYSEILHTVTFYYINPDWETVIIDTLEVTEGTSLTLDDFPTAPTRTGYQFQGWSGSGWTNITQNIEIHADYILNQYVVEFYDEENNLLNSQTINYGQCVVSPEFDDFVYYWDADITQPITAHTTFYAINTVPKYTVNFYDRDGDLIISQKIEKFKTVEAPNVPVVEGLTFLYWNAPVMNNFPYIVTRDVDFYAIYEVATYVVTVKNNINDSEISFIIEHGEIATPQPLFGLQYLGYEFVGWDVDLTQPVTSDIIVTALYDAIMYTVNYHDQFGNFLSSEQIQHGQIAVGPTPPEVEGYRFIGWRDGQGENWNVEIGYIFSDMNFYAHYYIIEFHVAFYSWSDDSDWRYFISSQYVEYGQCPVVPEPVERSGYTFVSWDKDVTEPIYEDTDFYSICEPKPITIYVFVKEFLRYEGNTGIYADPILVDEIIILYKEDLPVFDLSQYPQYQFYKINSVHDNYEKYRYSEECLVWLYISKLNFEIKISYYTLERIYYTTTNMFLFIPTGTETTYVNVLVYKTISQWIWAGDASALNFNELIGYGRGGDFAYKNVPGFEFIGWDNGTEDLLPSPEHNHYVAQYKLPQVKAMYYSSNGVKVLDDVFELTIVDILELPPKQNWLDGWIKGMADILLRFDIFSAFDDAQVNAKATQLFNAMIDARLEKGNDFQPKILIVQPNVKINIASGIFRDSAVHIESSDFIYLAGNSLENSFAYFTDWSMAYVTGLKYEMYVYYDTIYDLPVNVTTNLLTSIRDIIVENLWLIVFLFAGIPIFVSFFKKRNKKRNKRTRR